MLAMLQAGRFEYVHEGRDRSGVARLVPDAPRAIITSVPFGGPPAPHGVLDLIKLSGPSVTPMIGVFADGHGTHLAEVEPPGVPILRALDAGPLPSPDALAIAGALTDTLADVHARGQTLWGAFLDPELLYVAREAAGWRLTGVAPRGPVARMRAAAQPRGNYNPPPPPPIHLISPEAARGASVDAPADVFTVCACLHWWITGDTLYAPHHDQLMPLLQAVIAGDRAPTIALPEPLAAIVLAGTARDPAARPTAAQLRDRLAARAFAAK